MQGNRRGAQAVFFPVDDVWQVRTEAGLAEVVPGWEWTHPGGTVRAVALSLSSAGQRPTVVAGRVDAPLRIETHYDTVHIHRDGAPSVTLTGHAARMLTELGQAGTALSWEAVAACLWNDDAPRDHVRRRFDAVLGRTRKRLRNEGIRSTLLTSDGSGHLALLLRPDDVLDDRS